MVTGLRLENLLSTGVKGNKLILVYHGVVEKPQSQVSLGPISQQQFVRHLDYFSRNFDVVSQQTLFEMYRANYVPSRKTIAITFDDGYENNYLRAFPLLKQYNFPSTMYIISQCLEDDNLITWYDYLDFIKDKLNLAGLRLANIQLPQVNTINELKDLVKSLPIANRKELYALIALQINEGEAKRPFPREFWKLMNKQQVRELSDSGLVEIGAHSHNHPNLGQIPLKAAQEEVTTCKALLEEAIQKPVKSIAFPDGSYNDAVKQMCLQAGYENLLAVDYRCASDSGDRSILPRYCISSTTTFESNMIAIHRNFKSYGF